MQSRFCNYQVPIECIYRQGQGRLRWHWTGKKHAKSEADARGGMGSIGQKERAWGVFLLLGIEMVKLELLLKGEKKQIRHLLGRHVLAARAHGCKFSFHNLSALCGLRLKAVGLPLSAGSISFVACFGNRFGALLFRNLHWCRTG